ncbi:DUF5819 family protein [Leifsonia sp. NPDC058230]|uniref:DUF5819 family protein n=1 Tax=Leifsonia sp. NPDC058230 TaxID=3346391 RepID=UPI0036D8755A
MTAAPATTRSKPSGDREAKAPARRPRTLVMRIVLGGAALVTAWHVLASFLWIGPITPLRELIPGNALSSYMLPWFGQSWSVFAPAPINGDYRFHVRAVLADKSGNEIVTDWVAATDVELAMSHHTLFPARAANLGLKQASSLKAAWDALTPAQRKVAELNYFKGDDWLGRMQVALNEENKNQNTDAVVRYIVQERYSDAYAVQVARAIWGDSVIRVQYQASRQNIIPFEDRHTPGAQKPALQFAPIGWRGLIVMPGQSEQEFADVFLRNYKEAVKK